VCVCYNITVYRYCNSNMYPQPLMIPLPQIWSGKNAQLWIGWKIILEKYQLIMTYCKNKLVLILVWFLYLSINVVKTITHAHWRNERNSLLCFVEKVQIWQFLCWKSLTIDLCYVVSKHREPTSRIIRRLDTRELTSKIARCLAIQVIWPKATWLCAWWNISRISISVVL
jgi:hypothetical protein